MEDKTAAIAKTGRQVVSAGQAQIRILEAVDELFYRQGAAAVSVDEVARQAGVNKMSVYRQFGSKDALLLHYMALRDKRFWGYFDASLEKHPGKPAAQILQFFSDLSLRASQPGYRGCPFVNIAIEFPDREHPLRQRVATNKAMLMQRLTLLGQQAGASQAQWLAQGLALLIEGAYAASQTYANGQAPLAALPTLAAALLEASGITIPA